MLRRLTINTQVNNAVDLRQSFKPHLHHWHKRLLLIGLLLVTHSIAAIEQIDLQIGEIESIDGKINNLNARINFFSDNQFGFLIDSQALSLPPPYDALKNLKLSCTALTVNTKSAICKTGNLSLGTPNINQLAIPFELQITPDESSGSLAITAIPFTEKHSQLLLNWQQETWDIQPQINSLSLKPLTDLLASVGIELGDGLLNLNGKVEATGHNQIISDVSLSGKRISVQHKDATKAVEKLAIFGSVQAETNGELTQGQVEFKLAEGEVYLEPVYLSLKESSISGETHFLLDTQNNHITLSDFTLAHLPIFSVSGSLQTTLEQSFPPNQGIINVQIYNLANLFNHYIAPYLSANSVKPVLSKTQGLILSELEFADKQLVHLKLSTADVSAIYTFNNQDISVNNANITLNWRADDCTEQSFVYWKNAVFRGVPLPETVLRFKACGQQINFERNVTLPLLDGEMQFDHLDIKQLDNGGIDFSFATEISNISLVALSKAFDLPPLAGHISASIPSVRLENGGLRLDSSIHIDVFGGDIEIQNLQIDGMLGSYPILTADIKVDGVDLGKLSKRFSFGNIEGKLSGTINGLRIENQQVIAFDAEFSTPENRILPYSISQKAVENIASLGGSSPADLLSRGILKMFESFFYSRLGFSCKLRNNVCELNGVASAKNNGFYLIKGVFAPQINVIGYNRRVNWNELATRLKRISSQSSAVVE